jgi:PadR family transcriptional regulator, regulatory protein AphA
MQDDLRLTPTSYIVLGLVEQAGSATPYELKQSAAQRMGNFWSLQHAQLYTEPERLAGAGYLSERRERGGRRRRHYSLTAAGRRTLAEWRAEPTGELSELRDLGLLKLFLGADPGPLARAQLEAHRERLAHYQRLKAADTGAEPRAPWLVLESGIGHAREWISFWERVAAEAVPARRRS